jgi:hypothetical protein
MFKKMTDFSFEKRKKLSVQPITNQKGLTTMTSHLCMFYKSFRTTFRLFHELNDRTTHFNHSRNFRQSGKLNIIYMFHIKVGTQLLTIN